MIDRLLYWVVGRRTRWGDIEQGEGISAGDGLGMGGGWEKIDVRVAIRYGGVDLAKTMAKVASQSK